MTLHGIVALTNAEYHAGPGVSKSALDAIAVSPLNFWDQYLNPEREPREDKHCFAVGDGTHKLVLEPGGAVALAAGIGAVPPPAAAAAASSSSLAPASSSRSRRKVFPEEELQGATEATLRSHAPPPYCSFETALESVEAEASMFCFHDHEDADDESDDDDDEDEDDTPDTKKDESPSSLMEKAMLDRKSVV